MEQVREADTGKEKKVVDLQGGALDAIPEMVSLHDDDYNIIRANPALAKGLDTDLAHLIGRKCYEVFHGTEGPPSFCPRIQALATGTSVCEDIYEPKFGKHFLISVTPLNGGNSNAVRMFHVAHDITRLKEAESSLREVRDHLEELVRLKTEALTRTQSRLRLEIEKRKMYEDELRKMDEILTEAQAMAHLGTFAWNLRTNEITLSSEAQEIFGLSQPQGYFETILRMIRPDQREQVLAAVMEAIDDTTGQGTTIEFAITRIKDKKNRFVRARGVVEVDKHGKQQVHMRGLVWDITAQAGIEAELRATEEAFLESQKELRRLAATLILKEQGELRQLTMELKNTFEQRLGTVLYEIRKLKGFIPDGTEVLTGAISSLEKNIHKIMADARQISKQLYPSQVEQHGFVNAVQERCRRFSAKHFVDVRFESEGDARLLSYMAISLYRILEEALTNIARHARAKNVEVSLTVKEGSASLQIRDDGTGFDPAAAKRDRQGSGLLAIEEWTRLLGGKLTIECEPRQGTLLRVEVPVSYDVENTIPSVAVAPKLTKRQIDVVRLLAEGLAAKEIGYKLGISSKAVEFHKYRVMRILGIRTTAELIKFTMTTRLV